MRSEAQDTSALPVWLNIGTMVVFLPCRWLSRLSLGKGLYPLERRLLLTFVIRADRDASERVYPRVYTQRVFFSLLKSLYPTDTNCIPPRVRVPFPRGYGAQPRAPEVLFFGPHYVRKMRTVELNRVGWGRSQPLFVLKT